MPSTICSNLSTTTRNPYDSPSRHQPSGPSSGSFSTASSIYTHTTSFIEISSPRTSSSQVAGASRLEIWDWQGWGGIRCSLSGRETRLSSPFGTDHPNSFLEDDITRALLVRLLSRKVV